MPRRPVLALDIDSTLWNFSEPFYAVVNRLTSQNHKYEDQTTWEFTDNLPQWAVSRAFKEVIGTPENIAGRKLYPGCAEALQSIHNELGVDFVYLTHNSHPDAIEPALKDWLHVHTGLDFPVHVLDPRKDPSKIAMMKSYRAFGLIDDKPETILESLRAGFWTVAPRHPYNVEVIRDNPEVVDFDDWRDMPNLVAEHLFPTIGVMDRDEAQQLVRDMHRIGYGHD